MRGGATLEQVNATLAAIGLPPVTRTRGPPPTSLPLAPVAFVWSPLPGGSPRVRGNLPGNFWPGAPWVDWVGTDFYSQYPVWRDLNRFFTGQQWRGKPFALTEWAIAGVDDPRFARQVFAWTFKRPRVRMLLYYRGFGETGNPYALGAYPRTAAVIRQKIRRATDPALRPVLRNGPAASAGSALPAPTPVTRGAAKERGPGLPGPLESHSPVRARIRLGGVATSCRPCPACRPACRRRRRPSRGARR